MKIHEAAETYPLMSDEEFSNLVTDIKKNGLLHPIVLLDGVILDGRHRYKACVEASVEPQYVDYEGDTTIEAISNYVDSVNWNRRHINQSQRATVIFKKGKLLEKYYEYSKEAKERQGKRNDLLPEPNISESIQQCKVGEKIAKEQKINQHYVYDIKNIHEKAPDLFKEIHNGNLSIPKAIKQLKKKENIEKLESIEVQEAKAIEGVYDVIVIDPPWPMEKIQRDVAPNQVGFDYPTMSLEAIQALKLPCADDCHVWLWTTHKYLFKAKDVLEAWDLNYICTFVWHKNGGFQPFGLPQYNCEFVLYARRGTPIFVDTKDFMTCFDAKRTGHSKKPEEFYDTVRRVTAGRRLDMFNRREIAGFDGWGNESI